MLEINNITKYCKIIKVTYSNTTKENSPAEKNNILFLFLFFFYNSNIYILSKKFETLKSFFYKIYNECLIYSSE